MKITFLRHGHSNNSSSSHSLIFTRQEMPESNESFEFGWQYFTCSSKQDKLNYLLSCLHDDFVRKLNFPYLFSIRKPHNKENEVWNSFVYSSSESIDSIKSSLFVKWVEIYIGAAPQKTEGHWEFGYVDHQSKISFPLNRDGTSINHEFAKDFINEFVSNNWYVFGGNDNDDEREDKPTDNEVSDFEDFRKVFRFLTDTGSNIICVKDLLTGEYILSNMNGQNYNGSIIKIKF